LVDRSSDRYTDERDLGGKFVGFGGTGLGFTENFEVNMPESCRRIGVQEYGFAKGWPPLGELHAGYSDTVITKTLLGQE
jgi:hypothetical protein